MKNNSQIDIELKVFDRFVKTRGLPYNSFEKIESNFPDIRCEYTNETIIEYELSQISNEEFKALTTSNWFLIEWVRKEVHKNDIFNELKHNLRHSLICFFIQNDMVAKQKKRIMIKLLTKLTKMKSTFSGEVKLDNSNHLSVQRNYPLEEPSFDISSASGVAEPVVPALEKKLAKGYSLEKPVELVLYYNYDDTVMYPKQHWQSDLREFLLSQQDTISSIFNVIWVYDYKSRAIDAHYDLK